MLLAVTDLHSVNRGGAILFTVFHASLTITGFADPYDRASRGQ